MAENKQNKRPNVPPLRFPEFTDEWIETSIGSVLSIGNGRDYKDLGHGDVPVFGTGGYMTSVNKCLLDGESVFIGRKGTINKPFYFNGKFWTVDTLFYTHSFKGILPKFVLSIFENIDWLKYNEASGVPSLSKSSIEKIKICIPKIIEQQKISDFIDLLNHRIEFQSKLIEQLESLIKGIIHRLTAQSPNVRIADCLDCYSSSLQENLLNELGKCRVYGANGVCGYTDSHAINSDAILIVKDGSGVGNVSFATGEYSVIGTLNYLTSKSGYNLRYIYYCLMNFNFMPYKTGMAIPHIYFKDYGKAKIYCPALEEQDRIANILSKIERKIAIERSISDHHIKQKQYLLQRLFI